MRTRLFVKWTLTVDNEIASKQSEREVSKASVKMCMTKMWKTGQVLKVTKFVSSLCIIIRIEGVFQRNNHSKTYGQHYLKTI